MAKIPGFAEIVTAISSVGFPIVGCVYLIYSNNKNNQNHTEEVKKLSESINENTNVLIHLADVIEQKEEKR